MTRRTSRALFAVAALVAAGSGAAVIATVATASSPGASAFVPITPCRLFDTRPGDINVGSRPSPLTAGETFTVPTWGSNGNCVIPAGATGLSLNIVAINPTASSFLTVFPADVTRPAASSLNWVAGQAPTPNAVTARLGADGHLSFYNLAGTVDLAVDVVGYYETVGSGATGPAGPPGPQGPSGVDPSRIIWVAESDGDFASISAALASITDNSSSSRYLIRVAPGAYVENTGIDLKDWVDIEGSGATTVVQSNGSGTRGAAIRSDTDVHAEVRDLHIVSTGQRAIDVYKSDLSLRDVSITMTPSTTPARVIDIDTADVAIANVAIDGTSNVFAGRINGILAVGQSVLDVDHLTAVLRSSGGTTDCAGVELLNSTIVATDLELTLDGCNNLYGIAGQTSQLTISDSRITFPSSSGSARGIHVNTSTAALDSIEVDGNSSFGDGVYSYQSDVTLSDSALRGPTGHVYAAVSSRFLVSSTLMEDGSYGLSGMCVGVVDEDYAPYVCA